MQVVANGPKQWHFWNLKWLVITLEHLLKAGSFANFELRLLKAEERYNKH